VDYWSEQAEPMLSYWVSHYAREVPPNSMTNATAATAAAIQFLVVTIQPSL